jgi:SPP1 gp7 family putative phage head morphogenesis protein
VRQLRAVARQVGDLVKGFAPKGIVNDLLTLKQALERYGELLRPWAISVAARMTSEVASKDASAWAEAGRKMGRALSKEIANAPTGEVLRNIMAEQVDLITSLPRRAAERVHELTLRGITQGTRAEEIAAEILRTGKVTQSRAMTIARTEVTRTASALTMARATWVGSEGYVWRTAHDSDVRPLHKKLEGQFVKWDEPPVAGENGETAHAGMIYNCRCWMEPVLPDQIR